MSTVAGPSTSAPPASLGGVPQEAALLAKVSGTQAVAQGMPFNVNKPGEHGDASRAPQPGQTVAPPHPIATASTTGETTASPKVGSGVPPHSVNATIEPLDRVRVDSADQRLTTNQGVPVADNQNSLKICLLYTSPSPRDRG